MKGHYVKNVVSQYYQISLDCKSRKRELVRPRQVAMYLCRKYTALSYPHIARIFKVDHSTVIANVRKIESLNIKDKAIKQQINELERIVKNASN